MLRGFRRAPLGRHRFHFCSKAGARGEEGHVDQVGHRRGPRGCARGRPRPGRPTPSTGRPARHAARGHLRAGRAGARPRPRAPRRPRRDLRPGPGRSTPTATPPSSCATWSGCVTSSGATSRPPRAARILAAPRRQQAELHRRHLRALERRRSSGEPSATGTDSNNIPTRLHRPGPHRPSTTSTSSTSTAAIRPPPPRRHPGAATTRPTSTYPRRGSARGSTASAPPTSGVQATEAVRLLGLLRARQRLPQGPGQLPALTPDREHAGDRRPRVLPRGPVRLRRLRGRLVHGGHRHLGRGRGLPRHQRQPAVPPARTPPSGPTSRWTSTRRAGFRQYGDWIFFRYLTELPPGQRSPSCRTWSGRMRGRADGARPVPRHVLHAGRDGATLTGAGESFARRGFAQFADANRRARPTPTTRVQPTSIPARRSRGPPSRSAPLATPPPGQARAWPT